MSVVDKTDLICNFCGKSCSSHSGLTLHTKNCKKKNNGTGSIAYSEEVARPESKTTDIDPRISDEEFDDREYKKAPGEPTMYQKSSKNTGYQGKKSNTGYQGSNNKNSQSTSKNNQAKGFDPGAFMVLPNHVFTLLDYDFTQALADFILDNKCSNSAIVAFALKLRNSQKEE